ncbi:MAG: NrfD/PsrC family molybdoenzyme membrane anchor subunit [Chloroflexota bacterium]|nr:NrfD/PsrC family molybdoenzyme membrane anchor subunit [Chloroflexota bacterium]
MIQTRPFEFMTRYTPQREWIEGRGVLLWLAFFFIELGAGIFFVASLFSNLWGMFVGLVVCAVLGGGLHLLYLGHPFRFYLIFLKPQNSWISRGMIFVAVFLVLGIIHLGLSYWASSALGLLIVADIFAFLTVIYGGFAMNFANGIPLWNTALLPVLYVVAGFWGGAEVAMGIVLKTGALATVGASVEGLIRILLIAFVIIIAAYLISVRYGLGAGAISVGQIVRGKWAPLFWIVVVVLGVGVPAGVVIHSVVVGLAATSASLLYLSIILELIGDLGSRYLILKNGFYNPLTPISTVPTAWT